MGAERRLGGHFGLGSMRRWIVGKTCAPASPPSGVGGENRDARDPEAHKQPTLQREQYVVGPAQCKVSSQRRRHSVATSLRSAPEHPFEEATGHARATSSSSTSRCCMRAAAFFGCRGRLSRSSSPVGGCPKTSQIDSKLDKASPRQRMSICFQLARKARQASRWRRRGQPPTSAPARRSSPTKTSQRASPQRRMSCVLEELERCRMQLEDRREDQFRVFDVSSDGEELQIAAPSPRLVPSPEALWHFPETPESPRISRSRSKQRSRSLHDTVLARSLTRTPSECNFPGYECAQSTQRLGCIRDGVGESPSHVEVPLQEARLLIAEMFGAACVSASPEASLSCLDSDFVEGGNCRLRKVSKTDGIAADAQRVVHRATSDRRSSSAAPLKAINGCMPQFPAALSSSPATQRLETPSPAINRGSLHDTSRVGAAVPVRISLPSPLEASPLPVCLELNVIAPASGVLSPVPSDSPSPSFTPSPADSHASTASGGGGSGDGSGGSEVAQVGPSKRRVRRVLVCKAADGSVRRRRISRPVAAIDRESPPSLSAATPEVASQAGIDAPHVGPKTCVRRRVRRVSSRRVVSCSRSDQSMHGVASTSDDSPSSFSPGSTNTPFLLREVASEASTDYSPATPEFFPRP
eukprot:TRINITY_DN61871_c0_g1_i1.p1 TRINITY_DN61871_c0_g1~~TRINITY_DN61871_c0_g1_i1.p1  ORF type:complete len:639 (-),score=75.14 TRINITY_DN61871_c0_g1_i1:123-2039(-)